MGTAIAWCAAGFTLALAAVPVAGAGAAPTIGGAARKFPDTSRRTLVFTDQLPTNLTPPQWHFIATHYVGTQKEPTRWALHIRRLNAKFIILHYQLAVGTGPAKFLVGNQWVNDFQQVRKHKHWFLRAKTGRRVVQKDWAFSVMNIAFRQGKPVSGFPAYWVRTALARMRKNLDDGCFADSYTQDVLMNQTVPRLGRFSSVAKCRAQWLPQLNKFGAFCAAALHRQPEHFYYLPNLGGLVTAWDHTTNLGVGDGGMVEGFCAPGPHAHYATGDWKLQMRRILKLERQRKILLLQSYLPRHGQGQRWFVAGSYWLVKGNASYLNMFWKNTFSWYPQYAVPLGRYLHGPRRRLSGYFVPRWGVYRRRYAHGMVLVNPGPRAVRIANLGAAYRLAVGHGGGAVGPGGAAPGRLSYRVVHAVALPPYSACALLAGG